MPFDHFHFTNFASFSYGCTVFPFSLTSKRTSKLGELTLGILCYPFCSRSEYVIYKLKEMGKVSEKDVMQISNNFDRLDTGKCGKITLADLLESHHWHEIRYLQQFPQHLDSDELNLWVVINWKAISLSSCRCIHGSAYIWDVQRKPWKREFAFPRTFIVALLISDDSVQSFDSLGSILL